jgi:hypothetical protein
MTLSATKHPVELLRDRRGIYGIGIAKGVDIEYPPKNILLRPDRLGEIEDSYFATGAIFQRITGGFRHGMFARTSEEMLRRKVHHEMLGRAGLAWPPPQESGRDRWWGADKEQQIRNRNIYHGLRLGSLSVINRLIGKALEEAANLEAVKQARRFRFRYRQRIYRAGATSARALQLIEAFPALALFIFATYHSGSQAQRKYDAIQLVEKGVPLRKIADLMRIPMALRRVKPGAAQLALMATDHCVWDQRLIHAYMPEPLPRMTFWLSAIEFASRLGPPFVEWVAKHLFEIAGTADEIKSVLVDTSDWVRASYQKSAPPNAIILDDLFEHHAHYGDEFVTRPFSPDMSVKTVLQLSGNWHDAVANNMNGPSYEFPEPWCEGAKVHHYEIVPIRNSAELYREGHAMHHCVGTYGDTVRRGLNYIFSVREQGARVATIELMQDRGRVFLCQLRGSCNSKVTKEIERVTKQWLLYQKEFRLPKIPKSDVSVPNDICRLDDPEILF